MALIEDPAKFQTNQQRSHRQNPPRRRPRSRRCLLKGCNRVYRADHPLQRYCGKACRDKAKKWHRWKAQQKYRATEAGKAKRTEQCRRRRKRGKARRLACEAATRGARVIPRQFFRSLLRSPWMLRKVCEQSAFSVAAVLLTRMPASVGARTGAGTAMERARR
jgi:hypothetical protein